MLAFYFDLPFYMYRYRTTKCNESEHRFVVMVLIINNLNNGTKFTNNIENRLVNFQRYNHMIRNFIKTAWRNAVKNRTHSAISLISLILGLTFFCLIVLWIKDEMSFDKGFKSADRICRVETNSTKRDGSSSSMPTVGWPVGRALVAEYPEIESLTYMAGWQPIISYNGNKFYEKSFYADRDFFNVFGYELQEGNAATALKEPYSLVITQAIKEKYFGKKEALGKVLMLNDTVPYKITGVLKEQTAQSHLQFDMLGSFSSLLTGNSQNVAQEFSSGWFDINVYNYVKLKPNVNPGALTQKIEGLVLRDGKEAVAATGFKIKLFLRPVKDIYLHSGMPTGTGPIGSAKFLNLFALIGFFILIIACLNFINLTTAKSVERAKEIGIKKVLGSGRRLLIWQFLTESALFCIAAVILSILLVAFLLPVFNAFTGKTFMISMLLSPANISLMLGIIVLIVPIAGFYPAMVLSAYQPIKVLKGSFSHTNSGNLLRKVLVVTQFVISIAFILSTMVIWKQMKFMQKQDLGFDKDKILLVNTTKIPWALRNGNANAFKSDVLKHAGIQSISACWAVPGRTGWNGQFAYPEGRTKEQGSIVEYIPVDNEYVKTLGLKLSTGRDFIANRAEDQQKNLIVNEAAVKDFGWGSADNAIGKKLSTSGKEGVVIGVLKDYHQHGLQDQIKPVVLGIGNGAGVFAIRYSGTDSHNVVNAVRNEWNQVFKGYEFNYKFMDEDFQQQYVKEEKFESFFGLAAFLSIAIACLGLLGLAIYTAQKRTKEIGVRKVLGASVYNIMVMLSADFLRLVLISIVIASPLAWYAMDKWLQGFAYKVTVSWWLFPAAGAVAVVIALITISFHSIRAALANPVNSLRSE